MTAFVPLFLRVYAVFFQQGYLETMNKTSALTVLKNSLIVPDFSWQWELWFEIWHKKFTFDLYTYSFPVPTHLLKWSLNLSTLTLCLYDTLIFRNSGFFQIDPDLQITKINFHTFPYCIGTLFQYRTRWINTLFKIRYGQSNSIII